MPRRPQTLNRTHQLRTTGDSHVLAGHGCCQNPQVAPNALVTLGAVLLGGLMTVLGQLALEWIRSRLEQRRTRREREAAVRVIRFQFYSAQHVLKQAIEQRTWWGAPDELTLGESGQDLRMLADVLAEPEWRIYTSAWRRLRECSRLRPESAKYMGSADEKADASRRCDEPIPLAALQQLLGAFVTIDDARHRLLRYVVDEKTGKVPLRPVGLTDAEIATGLKHAGHLVDVSAWAARLAAASVPDRSS